MYIGSKILNAEGHDGCSNLFVIYLESKLDARQRTSIHGLGFPEVKSTEAASNNLSPNTNKATQLSLLHTKM
jgi:hypothetical protein